ncbi:MAG TPA: type II toxin-antitoxin system VapC family toxin [Thermoprotei archaeon]|nr:type II toxin-antitoxin system VapC family toxin [Thermoprotei archaeon]
MGEEEAAGKVVVDTYAIMAMVFDELTPIAKKIMLSIYEGRIFGVIPETVAYEFILQWYKGRIPSLKSIDEAKAFLKAYFTLRKLDFEDYVKAAEIKVKGDMFLSQSEDEDLRYRRLSLVDATIITTALKEKTPILTGDKDIFYVASKLGINIIW